MDKDLKKETEAEAVSRFAELMVAKLLKRKKKYREFGWRDPNYKSVASLYRHLMNEIEEWKRAETTEEEMSELIDVANTAFMLHDRLRLEQTKDTI